MTSQVNIRREHYLGIFIISLALLAYQIVLTRIFSVVLYYHFAIAGVTLAMLGLTLGAQYVFANPERYRAENFDREWAKAALRFAFSSTILVFVFLPLPYTFPEDDGLLIAKIFLMLFAIPFTYGGICITLILTADNKITGRLYAADLCGAALGCAGVVAALFYVDPVTVSIILAALSSFAAMRVAASGKPKAQSTRACILFTLAALWHCAFYIYIGHNVGPVEEIHFERWNAFSRVKAIHDPDKNPFGWGFGKPQKGSVDKYYLAIDAGSNAVLTKFDGDVNKVGYLANDVLNIGYFARPVKNSIIIGAGGGRDILSALYFGVQKTTALELNPAIIEALTGPFASYSGNIATRPDVELVNAEARSWLNGSGRSFDLVQISMINTWAATAAGGMALAENKLFTVQAWSEFLNHLNPQGMLSVARFYNPQKNHVHEFYRLLSLAMETLKARGIEPAAARNHIIAYSAGTEVTLLLSPSPFTPSETVHLQEIARDKNFTLLASANFSIDPVSEAILTGKAPNSLPATTGLDLSAPTDDHPFFFYSTRFRDALSARIQLGGKADKFHRQDLQIIFLLLLGTAVFLLFFITKPEPKQGIYPKPYINYFLLIGLGFMLIEISQMQRLMILLGHPVYGLSVVLFTLLLFSGIGSATVSQTTRPLPRVLLLTATLIITAMLMPIITETVKHHGVLLRIAASVAMLAPMAFFMGMMFPIGMQLSRPRKQLQPWFWGLNGAASVFASVLGMAISLEYGISATYWAGVLCYILCIPLTLHMSKHSHDHVTP